MMVLSPQVDFDSPPTLLIGGGLFFLMTKDLGWGWILILLGTILALKAYESRCWEN